VAFVLAVLVMGVALFVTDDFGRGRTANVHELSSQTPGPPIPSP